MGGGKGVDPGCGRSLRPSRRRQAGGNLTSWVGFCGTDRDKAICVFIWVVTTCIYVQKSIEPLECPP